MVRMDMGIEEKVRILISDSNLQHFPQCSRTTVDQYLSAIRGEINPGDALLKEGMPVPEPNTISSANLLLHKNNLL